MRILKSLPLLALALPSVALAAAPRTFSELANLIVSIIDSATGLLVVAGIVIYFYGISTNILKMRDEAGRKAREYMVWGIIVLFVMVSIWGILRLLQSTLFGSSSGTSSGGQTTQSTAFQAPSFTE